MSQKTAIESNSPSFSLRPNTFCASTDSPQFLLPVPMGKIIFSRENIASLQPGAFPLYHSIICPLSSSSSCGLGLFWVPGTTRQIGGIGHTMPKALSKLKSFFHEMQIVSTQQIQVPLHLVQFCRHGFGW